MVAVVRMLQCNHGLLTQSAGAVGMPTASLCRAADVARSDCRASERCRVPEAVGHRTAGEQTRAAFRMSHCAPNVFSETRCHDRFNKGEEGGALRGAGRRRE
jgi:hypothetical protein